MSNDAKAIPTTPVSIVELSEQGPFAGKLHYRDKRGQQSIATRVSSASMGSNMKIRLVTCVNIEILGNS